MHKPLLSSDILKICLSCLSYKCSFSTSNAQSIIPTYNSVCFREVNTLDNLHNKNPHIFHILPLVRQVVKRVIGHRLNEQGLQRHQTFDNLQLEGRGFYDFEMLAFGLCTEIFDNFGNNLPSSRIEIIENIGFNADIRMPSNL